MRIIRDSISISSGGGHGCPSSSYYLNALKFRFFLPFFHDFMIVW